MSIIEDDITTEEANNFVHSVAHRLELYSIAEQIHFAKNPFVHQCAGPLPDSCIRLKNAFIELMVTRSSVAECPVSREHAFDDLILFLDSYDPGARIPIFELSDMPHLSSHEDIRVGISMALRSIMQSAAADKCTSSSSLFLLYDSKLYPRLQVPIPIAGREVKPRRSSTTSFAFLFGRLLALSLAFNVQIPDIFPSTFFSALCGGRYFIPETLSILTDYIDGNNRLERQRAPLISIYNSSPVIMHQAMKLQPAELSSEENAFYQGILLENIRDDIVTLASIANAIGNASINTNDSTPNLISALFQSTDFDVTKYNGKFKIYSGKPLKSEILKSIRQTQEQIRTGKAFLGFYRELRTGFRTVFAAPSFDSKSNIGSESFIKNTEMTTGSHINTSTLKWYCEVDSLLNSIDPMDLKRLLVHPLHITPDELSQCITPQRSNLKPGRSASLQATVDYIRKFIFSLSKDSQELLQSLVIEATGFPYLTGVAIQVGDGPKPYLLPINLVDHAETHPTWARLMRSVLLN